MATYTTNRHHRCPEFSFRQLRSTVGQSIFLSLLLLSSLNVQANTANADDQPDKTNSAGKTLFEKEWKYESPNLPPKGNLNDNQYATFLRTLPGDGLGPMFNATSCEACHAGGGGADVDRNVTLITLDPRSMAYVNAATGDNATQVAKEIDDLYPGFIAPNGQMSMDVVVHESSARPFFGVIRKQLNHGVPGGIPNEWFNRKERTSEAIAQQPVIAGRRGNLDYYLSQRNSPALFGLGLIDKIEMKRLRTLAYNQSRRSGGKVSGRIGNGKFGWRAQTPSLKAFVMGACAGELGLQVPNTPQPPDMADSSYVSLGEDLDHEMLGELVSYVRKMPHPVQHVTVEDSWSGIREGKRLFSKVGCVLCHVENVSPARGIYSDLLLHDMGEDLQAPSPTPRGALTSLKPMRVPFFRRDNIGRRFSGGSIAGYYGSNSFPQPYVYRRPLEPTFPWGSLPEELVTTKDQTKITWDALQREWRTPPLWGVADSAPYLHDGRAKTLDAAIRWHGGESTDVIAKYRALEKNDRDRLILFLRSLRSPNSKVDASPIDVWFADRDKESEPAQSKQPGDDETKKVVTVFAKGY